MHQPLTLKITEMFPSIQGEGLRQGEPTLFIRLSGCNLKCSFCDTKYAWKKGQEYSTTQVLDKIKKMKLRFPASWVCLTGGEPMLQDVAPLTRELKSIGFKVQIETNATLFRPLHVDWFTISPKPEKYYYAPEYRHMAKEVKIIVTRDLKLEIIRKLRMEFPLKIPFLLQPQSNRKWSLTLAMKLLRNALKNDLQNIRLSIQLHKILGLK